jgi:hypothetical protein
LPAFFVVVPQHNFSSRQKRRLRFANTTPSLVVCKHPKL